MSRVTPLTSQACQAGLQRFRIVEGKLRPGDRGVEGVCSAVELLEQIQQGEQSISFFKNEDDLKVIKELLGALGIEAHRFLGRGKDSLVLEVPSEKVTSKRVALKVGERRYGCIPWVRPHDSQIDAPVYGIQLARGIDEGKITSEYLLTLQGIPDRFLTPEEDPAPSNLNNGRSKYVGADPVKLPTEFGVFDESGTKLLLDSGNYYLNNFYQNIYLLSQQRQGLQSILQDNSDSPQGKLSLDRKWLIHDVPIIRAEEIEWYC
jgi:hypothetical protein